MRSVDADFDATLTAARQGDEVAIARLYRGLQPRLLRVLRYEVGDAADDVASQTWLEVFGALSRFDGDEGGFRAFVFTIARRRVADHRRASRRRPSTPVEPATLAERVDGVDVEADVLDGVAAEAAVAHITAILGPEQAEVVLLRVVAGLPVEEVARMLGRQPGTVRVQQHRALRRLAAALDDPPAVLAGNDRPPLGDRSR